MSTSPAQVQFVLQRPPKTDDELYELLETLWGINIPRTKVCMDHTPPFEAFADAFFARSPVSIWKASRGFGGKSMTLALLTITEAVVLGAEANILGGSGAQSQNVHEHMREAWDWKLAPEHMIRRENNFETALDNGAKVRALMASQRSVRGPHPQRLRLDEIDEMDVDILDAALGQPMPKGGVETQTVMSSTHQYPDKTMTEMLLRASQKNWPVFEWCVAEGELVTTQRGDVPIQLLRPDDLVLTRMGFKPLQHLTLMGRKECIKVTLADGRSIVCTPDHLLHTPAGWVPANAALTVTTVGPDVPVRVPTSRASVVPLSERPGATGVLARRDLLQMLQTDARSVLAEMVDVLVAGVTEDPDPDVAVGVHGGPTTVWERDLLQSVPVASGSVVDEAGFHGRSCPVVGTETYHTMPVYDIGVEGAHEFFVNGMLVHNCWKETSNTTDGWLAPSTVERKRQEVTKHMWEVEYDLQEPTIGSRAFDTEMVEKMFSLGDDVYKSSGPLKGEQYTFEEPRKDADYVTGADWAKERDYTVIATFKTSVEPWELVAYSRTNRRPYPLMVKLMNDRVEAYGGGAIHDGTGLGNVVNDYLDHRVKSFIMAGRQRDDMLSEYVAAVEKGQLRAPKVESAFGEHKYCSIEDMYGRGTNAHLPDTVCAFALCWHLRKRGPTRVKPVIDVTHEDGSPWRALEVNKKDSNPGAWTL